MIQEHAAIGSLLDSKIRSGEFKRVLPYRFPLILGNDLAGVVVRTGRNVRPYQDQIGTFAEPISMQEGSLALKPRNLNLKEAASVPLVAVTAW